MSDREIDPSDYERPQKEQVMSKSQTLKTGTISRSAYNLALEELFNARDDISMLARLLVIFIAILKNAQRRPL